MHILVTGGTGFLGKRLVKELLKRRAKVTVFSKARDAELERLGAKFAIGDVLNRQSLENAFIGADVVYHLAAELDESSRDLWRINVYGTKNVVDACKKSGVKRIIFASSVGVLGSSKTALTEDMPYNPETAYEKTKVSAEKIVAASQIPYTIARMTIIYGANRFWQQILGAAKKRYPIIGSGNNYWHLVYADDAVSALICTLRPIARNKIYNIADADPHTYKEAYEAIARSIGTEPPKSHVPVFIAKLMAWLHEAKCRIAGEAPNVTKSRASIARLVRNRLVSIEKAKKELGFEPKYSLEEGMKKTVEEMQAMAGAAQYGK